MNLKKAGRPPTPYDSKYLQFKVPTELAPELKREIRIIIKPIIKEYLGKLKAN
jgi:hypothetical protein